MVWLSRRLDALATRRVQSHIHSVGIQSFEVLRADRIWSVLQAGLHGLRTLVLLASALVFVGYVLAQWPSTRGLSRDAVGFALAPLEVLVPAAEKFAGPATFSREATGIASRSVAGTAQ